MARLQYDTRLDEHKGQEGRDEAIWFDGVAHVTDSMPYLIPIQDRHSGIHLREEEVGAAFNELMGQEAGSSGVMRG